MRSARAKGTLAAVSIVVLGLATGGLPEKGPVDGSRRFQPLRIGAGGWVTGISMSNDGATRLVRTDTYGAYHWNQAAGEWALATTAGSLPASELNPTEGEGVLAVAVAPTRASRAYMAFNNAVFRSDDGARSWTKVLADVAGDPNDRWRYWGSRLEVDPANPDVVYYGTQTKGLLWSRDAGASWTQVAADAVAAPAQSPGVNAVAVDPYSAKVDGRSSVVYAASYGQGIFRSGDGGTSWARISDASVVVGRNLRVAPNGDLLATTHPSVDRVESISGNVHRWRSGAWTNIEPAGERWWHSIAVDAAQPGRVALMGDGGYLFMSEDYGDTWVERGERSMDSAADVPWLAWAVDYGRPYKWLSIGEIKFDPVLPGRLWLTEGVGVWYADLVAGSAAVRWLSQSRGIEQLVPTDVISAPGAAPVVSAWDRPILRSADPDTYPATYGPSKDFSGGWDLDWSLTDPDFMVASVASPMWPHDPSKSGYSTDGGQTWTPFATLPRASSNAAATFGFGNLAVSTPDNIVWAPSYGRRPAYTKDRGRTWQDLTLPGVTDYQPINNTALYMSRRIVTADRVRPGVFYLFMLGTGVFRTTDGGDTWARVSDYAPFVGGFYDYHVTLAAVPGREGHLFLTPGRLSGITTVPLRRSVDGGATWTDVANVTGVSAVGFGKAFSSQGYPAIYVAGHVNGSYGLYRSDDDGASWVRLGVHPGGKIGHIRTIEGDKNIAGRFYLSIHGGGWMRGDAGAAPVSTTTTVKPPVTSTTTTTAPVSTTTTTQAAWKPSGRLYNALKQARILDTRAGNGAPAMALGPNATLELQVTGRGGVPANGVSAVVMNVAVTEPTARGHVTAYPSGEARPVTANLNFTAGQTVSNLVVTKVGSGGKVSLYNASGSAHIVADVAGWYDTDTTTAGTRFHSLTPGRLLDTRSGIGAPAAAIPPNTWLEIQVTGRKGVPATGVSAVVMNVTVTEPTAPGYLTVYPTGDTRPLTANVNFTAGQTVPNLVVTKVGTGGKVRLYNNSGSVHLIADVVGWYDMGVTTGAHYNPLTPGRLLDTRSGIGAPAAAIPPNTWLEIQVTGRKGVPATGVSAVVMNVTVTEPTAPGYLTVYPTGETRPLTANVDFTAGQTVPKLVVVKVGTGGKVRLYNNTGSVHLIADVAGWYDGG